MGQGLSINKEEFLEMPLKRQNLVLFENTEILIKMIKGYNFELWTHRVAIVLLFIAAGIGKIAGVI